VVNCFKGSFFVKNRRSGILYYMPPPALMEETAAAVSRLMASETQPVLIVL
jgi:hypothetical protein